MAKRNALLCISKTFNFDSNYSKKKLQNRNREKEKEKKRKSKTEWVTFIICVSVFVEMCELMLSTNWTGDTVHLLTFESVLLSLLFVLRTLIIIWIIKNDKNNLKNRITLSNFWLILKFVHIFKWTPFRIILNMHILFLKLYIYFCCLSFLPENFRTLTPDRTMIRFVNIYLWKRKSGMTNLQMAKTMEHTFEDGKKNNRKQNSNNKIKWYRHFSTVAYLMQIKKKGLNGTKCIFNASVQCALCSWIITVNVIAYTKQRHFNGSESSSSLSFALRRKT